MVAKTETFGGGLDDLRAFCAVVDLGTVTAAAASRGETKGSLSRRISRLEAALGATLVARHPRAVSPTAEGLAFYAKVQESLALLDEAAETARDARTVPAGHLRVTTSVDFGIELMPGIVASFRRAYPQITVDMINTDARLDLAANRIDLALRLGDAEETGYRAALILRLWVGLYAAPDYLARRPAPTSLAALAEHDLILSRERPGALGIMLSDGRGRTEQVALSPAVRASDFAAVLRLTLAGTGIGHLPSAVAAGSVENGALVRVLAPWATAGGALRAVSLAGRELPARVRVFREHVRSEMMKRFAVEPDQAEGT
ncbi:LysR family transcriptional regulator [Methylobacterium sp. SD274]|jgi:DNA-binding transcriptional LysR family regulator|uniref:LysR family transcriptional regulator n=1 Tax=unclassified Methylobacterium TaxID=2615210 RepID=UPI0006FA7FA7|nr:MULTISPECIES: LysR family transcriptional regulator [unclassified Methylobacterium]KQP10378.1 LysR family transcriptional regulator [Methylobacterium sp. Leaf99]KQT13440.1 LysR family transcriptional regulator [Methylobacterium sp. Leaf399]MBO1022727.1 LysR family transcriptional regulator [Methylobacterium sp. SD274]